MGSVNSVYEIEMLRKYYLMVCNGAVDGRQVKGEKKLPIQRFVEKILKKKESMSKGQEKRVSYTMKNS